MRVDGGTGFEMAELVTGDTGAHGQIALRESERKSPEAERRLWRPSCLV